jgi:hypothetical protein
MKKNWRHFYNAENIFHPFILYIVFEQFTSKLQIDAIMNRRGPQFYWDTIIVSGFLPKLVLHLHI